MHQYQERDGEEDRKPCGKTCVKVESVGLKEDDALDRTKWKNDIQYHSGNPRWWEKPEEKKTIILFLHNNVSYIIIRHSVASKLCTIQITHAKISQSRFISRLHAA